LEKSCRLFLLNNINKKNWIEDIIFDKEYENESILFSSLKFIYPKQLLFGLNRCLQMIDPNIIELTQEDIRISIVFRNNYWEWIHGWFERQ
jgi:hypothetical protein